MGICASCLGLNRHPSQDTDETDALLDDQQAQYGGVGGGDVAQPDEEELRREREALQQITTEATDNMIDVLHPGTSELSHHFAHVRSKRSVDANGAPREARPESVAEDDEEAAWLQSVQAAEVGGVTTVKGLESGSLVMDISQLRDEPTSSTGQRSLTARLPS